MSFWDYVSERLTPNTQAVSDTVHDLGTAVAKNPLLSTAAGAALVAMGVPAPIASALISANAGASPEQIVKNAVLAGAVQNFGPDVASKVSDAVGGGAAGAAAANAVISGGIAAATGGNVLNSIAAGGVSSGVNTLLQSVPEYAQASKPTQNAIRASITSALSGNKNPSSAFINSLVGSAGRAIGQELKDQNLVDKYAQDLFPPIANAQVTTNPNEAAQQAGFKNYNDYSQYSGNADQYQADQTLTNQVSTGSLTAQGYDQKTGRLDFGNGVTGDASGIYKNGVLIPQSAGLVDESKAFQPSSVVDLDTALHNKGFNLSTADIQGMIPNYNSLDSAGQAAVNKAVVNALTDASPQAFNSAIRAGMYEASNQIIQKQYTPPATSDVSAAEPTAVPTPFDTANPVQTPYAPAEATTSPVYTPSVTATDLPPAGLSAAAAALGITDPASVGGYAFPEPAAPEPVAPTATQPTIPTDVFNTPDYSAYVPETTVPTPYEPDAASVPTPFDAAQTSPVATQPEIEANPLPPAPAPAPPATLSGTDLVTGVNANDLNLSGGVAPQEPQPVDLNPTTTPSGMDVQTGVNVTPPVVAPVAQGSTMDNTSVPTDIFANPVYGDMGLGGDPNMADANANLPAPPTDQPTDANVPVNPTVSDPNASFLAKLNSFLKGNIGSTSLTGAGALAGGAGLAGLLALLQSDSTRYGVPGRATYSGPLSQMKYNPASYQAPTVDPNMFRPRPGTGISVADQMGRGYAAGGHLGDYSDGGRLLRGPGDGVSDSIPASIGNKRPARLADGEFVVPARIVSELGNGSTEAGARQLYAMMDRIQQRRGKTTGKKNVAVDSKAKKDLPA